MAEGYVRVDVKGMKGVFEYLKRVERKTPQKLFKLTESVANSIVGKARTLVAPGKTGTGALKASIRAETMKNGHRAIAGNSYTVNRFGVNYAPFQEYGFTPHRTKIWNLNRNSRLYQESNMSGARTKDSIGVSKWTPFMGPAYRFAMNRLDNIELKRTADKIVEG